MRLTAQNYISEKHSVRLYTVILGCVLALAFLFHFFKYTLSAQVYTFTVFFLSCFLLFLKPVYKSNARSFLFLWMLSLLVVFAHFIFRNRNNAVLIDFLIMFSGIIICFACSRNAEDYDAILRLLVFAAVFFSAGVLLQAFLPGVHRQILRVFPANLATAILSRESDGSSGVRGFTTNTGFAGGYIIAGFFANLTTFVRDKKQKKKALIWIALFVLAILFTRKRGHLLFGTIAVIMCYLIPARGSKKIKRIWRVFVVFVVVVVFYFAAQDTLSSIPFFRSLAKTIANLESGEDITTGRRSLFVWAIRLFLQHPLTGIGWGQYRTTVTGVVTLRKSLDTHNVYLQLLSETGVIGFACFVSAFLTAWFHTKKLYCECAKSQNEALLKWRKVLFFSFSYQTYFLLYCLTGNPLFDQFYQIVYLFSCSIMVAYSGVKTYELNKISA